MRPLALVAATAMLVFVTQGCFGNECEGDVFPLDTEYGLEGDLVDETTWESVPMDERNETDQSGRKWMDFPARRTWRVAVPEWIDGTAVPRPIVAMTGYVSFGERPNKLVHCGADYCAPADNFTEGTGNIVEFKSIANGRVRVTNDTCSHFYLRLVLHAGPPVSDASPPISDAGPPVSDAGPPVSDAGADAQSPEPR
jgi:hypothetical protein